MSRKPSLQFIRRFNWLLLLFLTGCLSPQQKLAREIPGLRTKWQTDVAHQSALPERLVSWPEALALLQADNLKLRAARADITNSTELARQVYRDLIPTLNLRSGVSKSLKNLPATSIDDVTFNVDSFFNIPGVMNFNTRLFAGRLSVIRSKTAYQLMEREQTIELYKLFLEARENEELAAELETERRLGEAVRKADEISGQVLLKDIDNEEVQREKAAENFQTRVGDLLADRGFRWVLTTNGLPEFNYTTRPLHLEDTNNVAQLQMKLVALELVGAWAQINGIKLQYWPEVTIFVSGPSAFQFNNGRAQFWSSADIVGTADFFWSIDTRGYVSQQLRLTRRAQDLEKTQLQQDSLALIDRLLAARRLEGSLSEQAAQLDRLFSFLEKIPPDTDVASILQRAETNRTLHFQRSRLRRDLAELNTVFWFVDETKWSG
ncbi:MAG: hypothetical protein JWQ04_2019 [Pedosphaera sp.]|nr:hypothetical protein [Pedosphaera sp.]